jgi:hypothetical protein
MARRGRIAREAMPDKPPASVPAEDPHRDQASNLAAHSGGGPRVRPAAISRCQHVRPPCRC